MLFLDTFCNTIVSDYRTGEFGLSAWTLSLLSYLEKSIYQNSRVKSRASSRASENCCGGRLFRVHSTLPVGSVQLRIQHFGAEKLDNELNIKWGRTFLMTWAGVERVKPRQFCQRSSVICAFSSIWHNYRSRNLSSCALRQGIRQAPALIR